MERRRGAEVEEGVSEEPSSDRRLKATGVGRFLGDGTLELEDQVALDSDLVREVGLENAQLRVEELERDRSR